MVTVSLRLDEEMKRELDEMCGELGMSLSTFFMIYAKRALRDRAIPFALTAPADPFYSETNRAQLERAERQYREGKVVVKSMEELRAMEDAP